MSSPSRSLVNRVEKTPDQKSTHAASAGSPNGKRSHRSRSRSRDHRSDRHRDSRRDRDDHRTSHRDRHSRSRERSHRDRDRERERDRDRDRDRDRYKDRDSGDTRHRDRDDETEERRDRRRKRLDEPEDNAEVREKEERTKRKKEERDVNGSNTGSADGKLSSRKDRTPDDDRKSRRMSVDSPDLDRDRRRDDRDHRNNDRREPDNRHDRDSRNGRYDESRNDAPRAARPPSPAPRRLSPVYGESQEAEAEPEGDSEARSVFVSQLAARLTARDLGYFFEDKLGENAVRDARIVTDRLSRRSKGIGYVELKNLDLVSKALDLSGTIVMGLPILVQLTEAERNRVHAGDGTLNLPPGVSAPRNGHMQLYVGSLHYNLSEADIKQVFEPFGELEFVDLHRDPATGRSKGYAFVQYKRPDDAKMAMEAMDGFELAGRTLRVNTVHEKGIGGGSSSTGVRLTTDSLDDASGGNLNAASRQALMQKLARTEAPLKLPTVVKPHIPEKISSRSVVLRNMFNPDEETEADWDKELAEDVKSECESKFGPVEKLKVEKDSQGEIYVRFDSVESAKKAIDGLNGRWFGGKQVTAAFISDAIMQAHT